MCVERGDGDGEALTLELGPSPDLHHLGILD